MEYGDSSWERAKGVEVSNLYVLVSHLCRVTGLVSPSSRPQYSTAIKVTHVTTYSFNMTLK